VVRVLSISGSLRDRSTITAVLRTAAAVSGARTQPYVAFAFRGVGRILEYGEIEPALWNAAVSVHGRDRWLAWR
jgi:hypothetical protein